MSVGIYSNVESTCITASFHYVGRFVPKKLQYFNPTTFYWRPMPSPERERSWCMVFVRGIYYASFYDFSL